MARKSHLKLVPSPPATTEPQYEPDRTQTPESRGYQDIIFHFALMQGENQIPPEIQNWLQREKINALRVTKGRFSQRDKDNATGKIKAIIFCEKQLAEACQ